MTNLDPFFSGGHHFDPPDHYEVALISRGTFQMLAKLYTMETLKYVKTFDDSIRINNTFCKSNR